MKHSGGLLCDTPPQRFTSDHGEVSILSSPCVEKFVCPRSVPPDSVPQSLRAPRRWGRDDPAHHVVDIGEDPCAQRVKV